MAASPTPSSDGRSAERLRYHYDVERELADRLRNAPARERLSLYATVYDELFKRVPDHPQHTWKADPVTREQTAREQYRLLSDYLTADSTFLEIGAGDCALSFYVAPRARKVYGIDVSAEITAGLELPENFELVLSDGVSIPVPPNSVDVAFSNQLMEHLHPDDAEQQLRNIFQALAPGGLYVCITPNRFTGPADISGLFGDEVATGFHLKEYTNRELATLCRQVGFTRTRSFIWLKLFGVRVPTSVTAALERIVGVLPSKRRPELLKALLARLLGINMIAYKR